jgi:hypothetical protein
MGKFLRVLTVFNLLFAITSLVLGVIIFDRREVLLGRADTFEIYLAKLARVLETEPPAKPESTPDYEERDTSACTAMLLPEPMRDTFWTEYQIELEETDAENSIDFGQMRSDLAHYYLMDGATGKPKRDEMSGARLTDGDGTTQGRLDDFLAKANDQHALLQRTRQQLTDIRTQLLDTIREVNLRKASLREKLAEIVTIKGEIRQWEETIVSLQDSIAGLKDEISSFGGRIAELKDENRRKQETIDELTIKSELLKQKFRELQGVKRRLQTRMGPKMLGEAPTVDSSEKVVEVENLIYQPGNKGTVEGVQSERGFIVLRINATFAAEIETQMIRGGGVPRIDLFVSRDDDFVAKVRIIKLEDAGLAVAQILEGWQKQPIKRGDVIFHQ